MFMTFLVCTWDHPSSRTGVAACNSQTAKAEVRLLERSARRPRFQDGNCREPATGPSCTGLLRRGREALADQVGARRTKLVIDVFAADLGDVFPDDSLRM